MRAALQVGKGIQRLGLCQPSVGFAGCSYFRIVATTAIVQRDVTFPPQRTTAEKCFVEHNYRTRHAWLVVWYDVSDAVQLISITVTDPRFDFLASWLTFDQLKVTLGQSTFADVTASRAGSRLFLGTKRFENVGAHYFRDPGGYAKYLLSYNDAGRGRVDFEDLIAAAASTRG